MGDAEVAGYPLKWSYAEHHRMRIGDAGDAAIRAALGWREGAPVEAARIARRLGIGPDGATAPAVIQADTVRVSAEARAVFLGAMHADAGRTPAPGELIAAVRAVVAAGSPAEVRAAVERLGAVLRGARVASPGEVFPGERSARLLRLAEVSVAAVAAARGGSATRAMRAANVVRALATPVPGEVLAPERLLERAAAAVYLAAGRLAAEAGAIEPSAGPGEAGELPAALLSLAGAPVRGRRRSDRRERGRRGRTRTGGDDGGADVPGQAEADREPRAFV